MNPATKNTAMKNILYAILLISLAEVTSAQVIGGGLTGSATRMLQVNSGGELTPLAPGTSSQVLFGNGAWGNLPLSTSGGNTLFPTGSVGIGNNYPQNTLDVTGTFRVSGNSTIGGVLNAQSISINGRGSITSSTFGSTSVINIGGGGGGALDPGDNGGTGPHPGDPSTCAPVFGVYTTTQDVFQIQESANLVGGKLTLGFDGIHGKHFIEGTDDGTSGNAATNSLFLNYYCGKDVNLCVGGLNGGGTAGGFVFTGPNVQIGRVNSPRDPNIALNIASNTGIATAFNIEANGTNIFKIKNNGSTSILDIDPNQQNPLLEMTHSNGSTLRFMANGTGDITASRSVSMHFGSNINPNPLDNFAIYQGDPGNGIQHFYMNKAGSSFFRTTDPSLSNTAFMVVNNTSASGTGTDHEILKINNDGSTTIFDVDAANQFNPVLALTHSGGSTLSFMANGAGDIASSEDIRPHYQTTTGDFSVFQGIPGSGILHFSVEGDKGSTTIRTTAGNLTDDAFIVAHDPNMNMFGGAPVFEVKNDGSTVISSGSTSQVPFMIQNQGTPVFKVQKTGAINLGPRMPQNFANALLTVDGSVIVSQDIWVADQVTGNWADYVFKSDYKLMPLGQLENYIKTNKHLPNIPSAEEIKDKGQNLGRLQVLQMEKIEELTLYMLELKKENEKLKEEIQSIKSQLTR